jgi:hypothetical protein
LAAGRRVLDQADVVHADPRSQLQRVEVGAVRRDSRLGPRSPETLLPAKRAEAEPPCFPGPHRRVEPIDTVSEFLVVQLEPGPGQFERGQREIAVHQPDMHLCDRRRCLVHQPVAAGHRRPDLVGIERHVELDVPYRWLRPVRVTEVELLIFGEIGVGVAALEVVQDQRVPDDPASAQDEE